MNDPAMKDHHVVIRDGETELYDRKTKQVRFAWDRVLTNEEIDQLMELGLGQMFTPAPAVEVVSTLKFDRVLTPGEVAVLHNSGADATQERADKVLEEYRADPETHRAEFNGGVKADARRRARDRSG